MTSGEMRDRIRDILDDMHALTEDWIDLSGIAQEPTTRCPICDREWRRLNRRTVKCPACKSLIRLRDVKSEGSPI